MDDLQAGVGRQEFGRDVADAGRILRFAATLNHATPPWALGVLPPLGHWLCFLPAALQSEIGPDGHPRRGGGSLLPAVDLPRRMWAGSRIRFLGDVPLGASIERTSTLIAAAPKAGRSGRMLFATLKHEIAIEGGAIAIVEEQDIVYREAAEPGVMMVRPTIQTEGEDAIVRQVAADPVMLFRYSALTFNAHRIHYDREYCRQVEGYPGLVVHGPLLATLLLDHLLRHRPGAKVTAYSFRAQSPIFDGEPITLGLSEDDQEVRLRAIGPAGPAIVATARVVS